ncbi:hypothetical protein SESBI_26732 [Sesbania bispinosa]|nr:hypothetical protein SESBI_26732 [Sesbania bispinosa]
MAFSYDLDGGATGGIRCDAADVLLVRAATAGALRWFSCILSDLFTRIQNSRGTLQLRSVRARLRWRKIASLVPQ